MAVSKEKKTESEQAPTEKQGTTPNDSATSEETGEFVISYDRNTGAILNIANVAPSGERQELTDEEYHQFFAYMAEIAAQLQSGQEPGSETDVASLALQHQQFGFQQGYFHGLAEYEAALSGQSAGYSAEEEAAYNQGVSDYHALVCQSQQY